MPLIKILKYVSFLEMHAWRILACRSVGIRVSETGTSARGELKKWCTKFSECLAVEYLLSGTGLFFNQFILFCIN